MKVTQMYSKTIELRQELSVKLQRRRKVHIRAVSTHFELAKTTHFFPPTHSNFFYQLIQLIHFSITNSFNSFKK